MQIFINSYIRILHVAKSAYLHITPGAKPSRWRHTCERIASWTITGYQRAL